MEIIKIEKSKLIFILSAEDTTKYELKADSSSLLLKESYSRIISDNDIEQSFLSGVLVELFESKDGGLEMFVTKLSDGDEALYPSGTDEGRHIYIFRNLDDLTGACHMLKSANRTNVLIYESQGSYYLSVPREEPYISEFGAKKCEELQKEYLSEHFNLMPDNTLFSLAQLYK